MVPVINSMHTGHSISIISAPTPSALTRLRLAEPADDVDAMDAMARRTARSLER